MNRPHWITPHLTDPWWSECLRIYPELETELESAYDILLASGYSEQFIRDRAWWISWCLREIYIYMAWRRDIYNFHCKLQLFLEKFNDLCRIIPHDLLQAASFYSVEQDRPLAVRMFFRLLPKIISSRDNQDIYTSLLPARESLVLAKVILTEGVSDAEGAVVFATLEYMFAGNDSGIQTLNYIALNIIKGQLAFATLHCDIDDDINRLCPH